MRKSLEQQTGSEGVISPANLSQSSMAMLENAVRICEAKFGSFYVRKRRDSRRRAA